MRDLAPSQHVVRRALVALAIALGACRGAAGEAPATVDIAPLGGSGVSGTIDFTPQPAGTIMRVEAELRGLEPGNHGLHIHEYGDCSAPDGSSAGEHFNPDSTPHGGPRGPARHAGDLGNITANAAGEARLVQEVSGLTLQGPRGIVGRSVVVHETGDDLTSQPAGNSGGRIACGVIRRRPGETAPEER